jgi:hypothetical protein
MASAGPGAAASPQQFHCVANTVLSLLGACTATFAMSALLEGKFNMVSWAGLLRAGIKLAEWRIAGQQ